MQYVQDIHFENFWVKDFQTHGFIVNGDGTERIFWRNIHLSDIGEHFIKVNPGFNGNGVDDGIIEDSLFEFTTHAFGHFTGAIDIHRGKDWIIRKNTFKNFWHPELSVGPVLQFKNYTKDIVVERNFFFNNYMDIAMGFEQPNIRGVVRNNIFARNATMPDGDVAIAVWNSGPDGQAVGTRILNNTIWVIGHYPFAIDYRYPSTQNVLIANNVMNKPVQQREGAGGTVTNNITDIDASCFQNVNVGDLHLASCARLAEIVDRGNSYAGVTQDFDGDTRPQGPAVEIGADEVLTGGTPPPTPANPPATAIFSGTDTTTQGTWRGRYGSEGYAIVSDATSLPAYASVTASGQATYTWTTSTADVRALQQATGARRLASVWYGSTFSVDVNLTDGTAHQVAVYMVSWDWGTRAQRLEVRDAATDALLDSRTISDFQNGQYLTWTVRGHVTIRVINTGSPNAVVNGLFLD